MLTQLKCTRRVLLASTLLMAMPGGVRAAASKKTLRFVPRADLQTIDPMGSTADILKMHGFMIYDTLFAMDENFVARPQMVKDMTVSEDHKTYRFTLRDGLKWHDGQPVTAYDCVASLKRWAARDAAGQLMARILKEMRVSDSGTFEMEFNEP